MADNYFKLTDIRIRGLGSVIDSAWFKVGDKLTIFSLPRSFDKGGFLEALQSVNPPYSIEEKQPFKSYPRITRQGKYQKRVRPDRRTIALTIFTAQPKLVHKLAEITPHLYAADRVEVGRRMDYSRWINFVEIASSSRWSEVEAEMKDLVFGLSGDDSPSLAEHINSLEPRDRIKNDVLSAFEEFLCKCVNKENRAEYSVNTEEILFKVRRHRHFVEAKKVVSQLLPVFTIIPWPEIEGGPYEGAETENFFKLQSEVESFAEREMNEGRDLPIFLFDESGFGVSRKMEKKVRRYVEGIAQYSQCLYLVDEKADITKVESAETITLEDMMRK